MLAAGAPSTSACNDEVQAAAVDVGAGGAVGAMLAGTVDVGAAGVVGALLGSVVALGAGCCVAAPGLGGAETGSDVALDVGRAVVTFADGVADLAKAALDAGAGIFAPELACTWFPRAGGAMREVL